MIVIVVVTLVARHWRAAAPVAALGHAERILVCVGWPGEGAPVAVGNLLAKAARRERLAFAVAARAPGVHAGMPNVRFAPQADFAGASLAVARCLTLSDGEPLVLTVESTCDALSGWDVDLERALATCPPRSVLTYQPSSTTNTGFPCVERIGARGIHTRAAPRRAQGEVLRVLCLTEACSFGPRARFDAVSVRAPSRTASDTAASWQMHAAGWSFYAPPRAVLTREAAAPIASTAWHVDALSGPAASAYLRWLGIGDNGTPNPRARLGLVDSRDPAECVAKYGSVAHVRGLLGHASAWPTVHAVRR